VTRPGSTAAPQSARRRQGVTRRRSRPATAREISEAWIRERPDLDLRDFLLELYLTRLGRIIERLQDRASQQDSGLTVAEMRALFALRRAGAPFALRPAELIQRLLVTAGAVTKQVDRLSAAGLVERLPDPASRKSHFVRLTDKGRAMVDRHVTLRARSPLLRRALETASAEDKATVLRFFAHALDVIEHD
jgi:DNA-binding MarR family transcriptional regulator